MTSGITLLSARYINLFLHYHALSIDNDPQVFAGSQLREQTDQR